MRIRRTIAQKFPEETFFSSSLPDITNQTLNFGCPRDVDVQVRARTQVRARIADRLEEQIKDVPGAVDVFLQQEVDAPKLNMDSRTGSRRRNSRSRQRTFLTTCCCRFPAAAVAPNFWLEGSGDRVEYPVIVQVSADRLHDLETLERRRDGAPASGTAVQLLLQCFRYERQVRRRRFALRCPALVVFATWSNGSGGVSRRCREDVRENSQHLSPGVEVVLSGQVLR